MVSVPEFIVRSRAVRWSLYFERFALPFGAGSIVGSTTTIPAMWLMSGQPPASGCWVLAAFGWVYLGLGLWRPFHRALGFTRQTWFVGPL